MANYVTFLSKIAVSSIKLLLIFGPHYLSKKPCLLPRHMIEQSSEKLENPENSCLKSVFVSMVTKKFLSFFSEWSHLPSSAQDARGSFWGQPGPVVQCNCSRIQRCSGPTVPGIIQATLAACKACNLIPYLCTISLVL